MVEDEKSNEEELDIRTTQVASQWGLAGKISSRSLLDPDESMSPYIQSRLRSQANGETPDKGRRYGQEAARQNVGCLESHVLRLSPGP